MKRWIHNDTFEQECKDYFLTQAGIYLDDYRNEQTKQFDRPGMLNIDWDAMPKSKKQSFLGAINMQYSPYIIQDQGRWMKCIMEG